MIVPVTLIVVDKAAPETLNAIHAVVKTTAKGWWHRMSDVWIVGGEMTPSQWRALLAPLVEAPTVLLAVRLPSAPQERLWSIRGSKVDELAKWLHEYYRK